LYSSIFWLCLNAIDWWMDIWLIDGVIIWLIGVGVDILFIFII